MNTITKRFFLIALLLALGNDVSTGQFKDKATGPSSKPRQKVPVLGEHDFTLRTIEGKEVRLSDYAGQIVLVNIWAPWCGPCRAETPGFVSLYEKYHQKGFEIIGVAVNTDKSEVRSFIANYNVRWPVGIGEAVAAKFGTTGIPDNYLFAPDGTILKHWVGFTSEEELERAIKQVLNKAS